MNQSMFERVDNELIYRVPTHEGPIRGLVRVPGSKSITNRALLIAALAEGKTDLEGVLFSDDSRHFLGSLESLGYDVVIHEDDKRVSVVGLGGKIPKASGTINVGSAGTAARFLTAMLALSEGEYVINCSEQMKKRPMEPLFKALEELGASFDYLEAKNHLPVKVKGCGVVLGSEVTMDITKSTQFLSALLMVAPMLQNGLKIKITSERKDGSYIRITSHMMEEFGMMVDFDGEEYRVPSGSYKSRDYYVEPDVSAACYYYSIAALTGGEITVKGVFRHLMQGDMKFLEVLEMLGCELQDTEEGIKVIGPIDGIYEGVDVDLKDFSDQTMTLAVLAVFANSQTIIRNVAHIKLQECDRMDAIVTELTRVGIKCQADGKNITIVPGKVKPGFINTYDDHRMSMAFTLLGLKAEGIVITDPMCCRKTFENYFDVFIELIAAN